MQTQIERITAVLENGQPVELLTAEDVAFMQERLMTLMTEKFAESRMMIFDDSHKVLQ